MQRRTNRPAPHRRSRAATIALAVGGGLGVAAIVNAFRVRAAEAANPPMGRFVEVDGVRVHYTEHGAQRGGTPVVLIHGNFSMVQDFELSDVTHRLALHHRVIAFDRPGFGYTDRPAGTKWTAERQAALLAAAAAQLGVVRPVLVGHSWGTLAALAWALDFPQQVSGLVLMSGYYFPTMRPDVLLQKPLALPVIGDIVRWTIAPIQLRVAKPLGNRQIFGPSPTNEYFDRNFPWELAARPSQIRATIADTAQMTDAAASLSPRYAELTLPVTIVVGDGDRLVDYEAHSVRLAHELPQAKLVVIPGAGHMVQHIEPGAVTDAIKAILATVETPVPEPEVA